jgi:hypothetical protein
VKDTGEARQFRCLARLGQAVHEPLQLAEAAALVGQREDAVDQSTGLPCAAGAGVDALAGAATRRFWKRHFTLLTHQAVPSVLRNSDPVGCCAASRLLCFLGAVDHSLDPLALAPPSRSVSP